MRIYRIASRTVSDGPLRQRAERPDGRGAQARRPGRSIVPLTARRLIGIAVTVWLLGAGGFAPSDAAAGGTGTLILKTDTGEHRYTVELATTTAERAKGLMFRSSMPQNAGMLFVYDAPRPIAMWMRNTYIPLDMVFIREDGTVHRVEANTEPFSTDLIQSEGDVTAVLELNAGVTRTIGLKPGDRVVFPPMAAAP